MTDRYIASRPIEPEGAAPVDRLRAIGLIRNPFTANGPLVTTPAHQEPLAALTSWSSHVASDTGRPDRLAMLTGETGSGKSRLIRELAAGISAPAAAPVIDPGKGGITDAQLLRAMVDALGGTPAGRTGLELRRDIRAALADLPEGTVPGLIIDDADFTGARLELVRNVLRDGTDFGLWIILAGQPDLADRVTRRRSLRALLGPVTQIAPVEPTGLRRILSHRIEAASAGRVRPLLDADALEELVTGAAGNPGRLLRIAEVALGIAVRQGAEDISRTAVLAAIHQVDDTPEALRSVREDDGVIQVEMPLLAGAAGTARSATVQRSLWEGEVES